jgi:hypothetical protein
VRIFTVLRSGGEFKPKHVQALQRMVVRWSPPGTEFICLSDVRIDGVTTIPLKSDWPRFWAKMELFDPSITGDIFYLDIDTVILGPIKDFLNRKRRVVYGGACWFLRPQDRKEAGEIFRADPVARMKQFGGEDVLLRAVWAGMYNPTHVYYGSGNENKDDYGSSVKPPWPYGWEAELPGQMVHRVFRGIHATPMIFSGTYTANTRIVVFSMLPRPWHTTEFRKYFE